MSLLGPSCGSDIEHARDMLAPETHRCPSFAQEPLHDLRVVEHLGQQELHRDRLVELQVHGLHDDAHATLTQDPIDAVLPSENRPDVNHAATLAWRLPLRR